MTTYHLLHTTHSSLPTTYHSLPANYHLLPTIYHLLPTTYYSLLTTQAAAMGKASTQIRGGTAQCVVPWLSTSAQESGNIT